MLYKHDGHQMSLSGLWIISEPREGHLTVCPPSHPCRPSWPRFPEGSWDRASMIEDRGQKPKGLGEFAHCGIRFSLALSEPRGQSQLPRNAVSKGPCVCASGDQAPLRDLGLECKLPAGSRGCGGSAPSSGMLAVPRTVEGPIFCGSEHS